MTLESVERDSTADGVSGACPVVLGKAPRESLRPIRQRGRAIAKRFRLAVGDVAWLKPQPDR